jgi:hypothetical protein
MGSSVRRFAVLDPSTWPGTRFDWAFSALAVLLMCAGYYDAWIDRQRSTGHPAPLAQLWPHASTQAAWLLVTLFLAGVALYRWPRDRRLEAVVPDGYWLSAIGCGVFAVGILTDVWLTAASDVETYGVAAIFRPSNLIEIAGAGLIVTGPLRAAIGRGELVAGPTAIVSATLLLATFTFFSQFDHPYVNPWAFDLHGLPDPYKFIGQLLGALGLLMQAVIVTGVVLIALRHILLPPGSITFMLTATAFLICTQLGHFEYVWVGLVVGAVSDLMLVLARPRSDRLLQLRFFAAGMGLLLPSVYLVVGQLATRPTYWIFDVIAGSILVCGMTGWLVSYLIFPDHDSARAAAVLWPPMEQDSSKTSPDITVERLEHALRVLNNSRDLGESPLVGMRCLPSRTSIALRQVIEEAIASIRTSPSQVDAQAGEILNLYYVRRIGGHYAVEMRVGLSRAAYFNRRSYGVRRLVDQLKELEEKAAPA